MSFAIGDKVLAIRDPRMRMIVKAVGEKNAQGVVMIHCEMDPDHSPPRGNLSRWFREDDLHAVEERKVEGDPPS